MNSRSRKRRPAHRQGKRKLNPKNKLMVGTGGTVGFVSLLAIFMLKSNAVLEPVINEYKSVYESKTTIETEINKINDAVSEEDGGTTSSGNPSMPGVQDEPTYGAGDGSGELVKTVNNWLNLYDNTTVSGSYRVVPIPDSYRAGKWPMGEGNSSTGSSYCRNYYEDRTMIRPNNQNEGYVNSVGRYWVAVGPKVTNKDYNIVKDGSGLDAGEMALPKLFDVVIKSTSDNTTYYIPCVAGDAKAHTYPTGIVQTGEHISTSENVPSCNDSSIVEFIGVTAGVAASIGGDYEIVSIYVYE